MTEKKERPKIKDLNIAFVDTETTGLDSVKNEIIEIAAIIYNPNTDTIIKEWSKKAKPRRIETADEIALNMNGYNDDPESYQGDISEIMNEYAKVVDGCIIAGQNIQFDIDFIEEAYKECGIKKSIRRHRKLEISSVAFPIIRNTELNSMGLADICNHFNISNDNSHRALIDCRRTLEVYKCVTKIFEMARKIVQTS